jgi:hypothetical protein
LKAMGKSIEVKLAVLPQLTKRRKHIQILYTVAVTVYYSFTSIAFVLHRASQSHKLRLIVADSMDVAKMQLISDRRILAQTAW